MQLIISPRVREKLALRHRVTEDEIIQCFANRSGKYLMDTREAHKTEPQTLWFVAETDVGRRLKVIFMQTQDGIVIKSAYEPSQAVFRIYNNVQRGEQ
jgi:hypothetical protein